MEQEKLFRNGEKTRDSLTGGFYAFFRSFGVLKEQKGLTGYFIIPFLLNIVILSSIFFLSYSYMKPLLMDLFAGDAWYLNTIRFLIGPLLVGVLFFLTVILYSIAGSIITSPFNDILSLKVEEKLTGADFDEKFSLTTFISDLLRVASNVIKMLFFLLIVNTTLLVLNLVPVAGNIVYSVLSFLVTAFFLGFQFFDFPLERRKYRFNEKLRVCIRFRFQVIGLGTAFFLTSFVPLVGFMGLNCATIGATLLFIENIKPVLDRG
jgi:CysZ protein